MKEKTGGSRLWLPPPVQEAGRICVLSNHLLAEEKDGPPPEWENLKKSSQIVRGRLFRSGRMIDSF